MSGDYNSQASASSQDMHEYNSEPFVTLQLRYS